MNQVALGSNISIINDEKKKQLLKDVFFKGASDEEFQLFAHACESSGLNPFMRQIYPVKRWDANLKREAMTIQTGIDGYRLIAERTGCYSPGKDPSYAYNKEGDLISSTAYVKKMTKDSTWHEIAATAFYEEYCQKTKDGIPTSMWKKMPHNQLAKCAEALALRKAFPAELSGIYTKEEMEQSEVVEAKITPVLPEIISQEQAFELEDIISACSAEYKKSLFEFLMKQKVARIQDLPSSLFDRVKTAALKKKKEHEDAQSLAAVI